MMGQMTVCYVRGLASSSTQVYRGFFGLFSNSLFWCYSLQLYCFALVSQPTSTSAAAGFRKEEEKRIDQPLYTT